MLNLLRGAPCCSLHRLLETPAWARRFAPLPTLRPTDDVRRRRHGQRDDRGAVVKAVKRSLLEDYVMAGLDPAIYVLLKSVVVSAQHNHVHYKITEITPLFLSGPNRGPYVY